MLKFLEAALQPNVYRTAFKVCLLVGTVLAIIARQYSALA